MQNGRAAQACLRVISNDNGSDLALDVATINREGGRPALAIGL
jgi:hypothetical protein